MSGADRVDASANLKRHEARVKDAVNQVRKDIGLEAEKGQLSEKNVDAQGQKAIHGIDLPRTVTAQAKKATGGIDLHFAAGSCSPIHILLGGEKYKNLPLKDRIKDYPGFDVARFSLESDGERLTIAATLKNPPVTPVKNPAAGPLRDLPTAVPHNVVDLFFDTDNNPKTGVGIFRGREQGGGFELKSQLYVCLVYDAEAYACDGAEDGKVTGSFAGVELGRFEQPEEGQYWSETEPIADIGNGTRLPIVDNVVKAELKYADLKVKSGQTIRIVVKKSCGGDLADDGGFSPEILLTLK